ncbi:MAG: exodeoxyribonuclease large subunit [Firmicutes bacterium]|nr:exodeoxyribonuclease large subunit [Bacillota bacterium]
MGEAITVSALNLYIKQMMDGDTVLSSVLVRGEISNYKVYPSGHHYFSLKDAEGSIRCVMFRREAVGLRFRPEQGMKVIAEGRVTVFPRDGQYQLYCNRMIPDGIGDLHLAFEQCKAKLEREGLFDPRHKKPLPAYPEKIALVTSPAGAAVRDMIRILGARYPLCQVLVVPVRVQGAEAPSEIAGAIDAINRNRAADLIITGRGGGSLEDLWAFNEELVARAIHRSEIPVISAVGHEPDVTIADYVADLRAATPSNAAELAVPDSEDLRRRLRHLETRMAAGLTRDLREGRRVLDRAKASPWLRAPLPVIQESRQLLDYRQDQLVHVVEKLLLRERTRLGKQAAALDALSPLKVLGRGYAIVRKAEGEIVLSTRQVDVEEALTVRLNEGELICRVERKEP